MNKDNFFDMVKKYPVIIVYGAQAVATATIMYLEANKEKFEAEVHVAVTSKVRNPDNVLHHKVQCVDELLGIKETVLVIIAVRKYASDVIETVLKKGFTNYFCMDLSLLRDPCISYESIIGKEKDGFFHKLIDNANVKDTELAFFLGRANYMLTVDVQIVGHCNLNCQSCNVFAPLVEEEFLALETFQRDIERLAILVKPHQLRRLTLIGGEPFLHPQIESFVNITRNYYKDVELDIFTNGILLEKIGDNVLNNLAKDNITITFTKYPIDVDYDLIEYKLNKAGIYYRIFNGKTEKKVSHKVPIDYMGSYDRDTNYAKCHRALGNTELRNGKLYPCSIAPSMYRFNDYFGKDISLSEYDGVNIYEAVSYEELMEKLNSPMEICRYCGVCDTIEGIPWNTSKRTESEWVI